jgi:hypothetical protein
MPASIPGINLPGITALTVENTLVIPLPSTSIRQFGVELAYSVNAHFVIQSALARL